MLIKVCGVFLTSAALAFCNFVVLMGSCALGFHLAVAHCTDHAPPAWAIVWIFASICAMLLTGVAMIWQEILKS